VKPSVALWVGPILSVVAVAAPAGDTATAIDRALTEAAAARGFGGAIVATIKGEVVLSAGYGLANRETAVPFTVDTPAQVGSITKLFTGLAASQLIAEGKLDPNVPIRRYLPESADPAAGATLHQLLTHTAGLSDYCGDDFAPRTRAELLSVCMAKPLEFPSGSSHYSNMGVSFAAAVIEHVSGKRWEDYLRERIWSPFGMKDTGWTFPGRDSASFAVGYLNDKPQGVISNRIAALGGADWHLKGNGGMQASAADMLRFYRGLMSQPEAVRAILLAPHADGESRDVKDGYGLFFRFDASGQMYRAGHSGSDGVFFSYLAIYPHRDAFFYFVGNNGEAAAKSELVKVLELFQHSLGIVPPPR
jgi:CubicO group peptidase (beta-lactamase class C family)